MAEALDLNIPLGEGGAESVEKIIKPLLDLEKEKSLEEKIAEKQAELDEVKTDVADEGFVDKYIEGKVDKEADKLRLIEFLFSDSSHP